MAIFPELKFESVVQVLDKTRLDASTCFVSPDLTIVSIEIDPDGTGYIDVSSYKVLDWSYATGGAKAPKVKVTASTGFEERTFALTAITAAADNLFSNDEDLQNHEPDILKWVRDGRSSYLDMHRRAQELILDTIYRLGYRDNEGNRFKSEDVKDILEVKEWSTFAVLALIFKGLSNAVDDVFAKKSSDYMAEAKLRMTSAGIVLDRNSDGETTVGEQFDMTSIFVVRR